MLKISKEQKEAIKNGDMTVLIKVLEDEKEYFRQRLLNEKNEFSFIQGAAYYSEELRKLFVNN